MFGLRSDGKKAKDIDPFMRIIPHVMKRRSDAQVFYKAEFDYEKLRESIKQFRKDELDLRLMHVLIAALVRLYYLRPKLNRFIMNGRVYDRNDISISFTIKKALKDDAKETTVKLHFTGKENLREITEKINEEINKNLKEINENGTDVLAKTIMCLPNILVKVLVGLLKWLDQVGLLPKSILKVSPFHTSVFITNLKSIGLDFVYHHIYDFGTTGLFVSIGKEKDEVCVARNKETEIKKVITFGVVADERICDGLYFANSMRVLNKLMEDPYSLLYAIDEQSNEQSDEQAQSEAIAI